MDLKSFFDKTAKAGKKVALVYYAAATKLSFFMNVLDTNGKPIQKRHPSTGQPVFYNGKEQFEDVMEQFDPVVATRSAKADALCFKRVESDNNGVFTPYQKALIERLEKMADDQGSPVKRESKYKEEKNPEAYKHEVEFEKLKKEVAERENSAYEKGKQETLSEMEELKKRLAEAEKEVDSLTAPKKNEAVKSQGK